MSNSELIQKICKAFQADGSIVDVYNLDSERFDHSAKDLEELFITLIGQCRGPIAFKIFQSQKA